MLLQQCSLFRVCLRMEFQVGPTLNRFSSWLINWNLDLNLWGLDQSSVRPKPGFRIRNRNQGPILVLVLERIFFPETETFASIFFVKLQIFLIFALFLWNTNFYTLENKTRDSKMILKNLMFGRKFIFMGPFIMVKIPHAIGN